jgi:undecaprenyl-diphosphatase
MQIWQAAVLGVVQGLTEFLPISSTAHLLLVQEYWFGRTREELEVDPFTVVIQLGTLFAVFIYFRTDILAMLKAFTADVVKGFWIASTSVESRLAKLIILGSIPAGIAGLTLKKPLKKHFYNAESIAIVAIVFALMMFAAEWWAKRRKSARGDDAVTLFDSLFIGCFQALALMPGGSRSGCTITAGLFAGLSRSAAARFSFLLSIPIMAAAGVKELYDWSKLLNEKPDLQADVQNQLAALAVGTLVSAIVGYFAIWWLLAWLRKYSMNVFVVYRIVLGIAILLIAGKVFG